MRRRSVQVLVALLVTLNSLWWGQRAHADDCLYQTALAPESTVDLPIICHEYTNFAPGDEGLVSVYAITYNGKGPAPIRFSASVDGPLFTGTHPLEVLITDDQGRHYRADLPNQPVRVQNPGSELRITVRYRWPLQAGNEYQSAVGRLDMRVTAGPVDRPNPPTDPPTDPPVRPPTDPPIEPPVDPPTGPPPGEEPPPGEPPGPAEEAGQITVQVLDGSGRSRGVLRPIANASVTLSNGLAGTTDANGKITLANLPFGSYTATASALNPLTGREQKSGSGTALLSRTEPRKVITILLSWSTPWTPNPPDGGGTPPVTPEPPGPVPPGAAAEPGAILGRICLPRDPGAQIHAIHQGGQRVSTFIASTGKLGRWVDYALSNLTPGTWTITLVNPGDAPAEQRLIVGAGESVQAADFTLACTGESSQGNTGRLAIGLAGGLLLGGFLARRRILQGPAR